MNFLTRHINRQELSIVWVSLFIMVTGNFSFFGRVLDIYPLSLANAPFLASVFVLFFAATLFVLNLIVFSRAGKWVLAFVLFASAAAGYFMDTYGAMIDADMLTNMLQTNTSETLDLLSWPLVLRLAFLGILPAWLMVRYSKPNRGFWVGSRSKAWLALLSLVLMACAIAPLTSHYATFFRAHKSVRFYANPTFYIYSVIKLGREIVKDNSPMPLAATATDSKMVSQGGPHKLTILVVGETARADHFSLNGYPRNTNPELEKIGVLSLKNMWSCGTATAVSVPCMFSDLPQKDFDIGDAKNRENALDVLKRLGVQVLWRDNNSDSKAVALRIEFQDYKKSPPNTHCDSECRDVGMLVGLQDYINKHANKDILIVLHQMGNHGPAYYKRYPKQFEKFTPVCKTNELAQCSQAQIINAYDNAILYTDHFLAKVIDLLKANDDKYATTMAYLSDHGESLGENGLYLHGAPYAFAPDAQKHVPAVLWFGKNNRYSIDQFKRFEDKRFSHDDLFCALLLGFDVETSECKVDQLGTER